MDRVNRAAERAGMWAGHYSLQVNAIALTAYCAAALADALGVLPEQYVWVRGMLFVPILYATLNRSLHDRKVVLCTRHLYETPDDPAAAVQRRRRTLRMFHRFPARRTLMAVGLSLIAAWLLLEYAVSVPQLVTVAPLLVVAMSLAGTSLVIAVHQRLQPWCPDCRRRGPGKDRLVAPPGPTGSRLPTPA